jgi:ribosome recycling factor
MFDKKSYELKMAGAVGHFQDELKKVRTGRAHPDMLSGIFVEVYGAKMPLNQVATVTAPEPQLLQVTPFDQSNVKSVSDAIRNDQGLGFNPSDDGRIVRVNIPALTEERRKLIVKQLGEKVENTRVSLRNIRQDAQKDIKKLKENKEIGEDEAKRFEKDIDEMMSNSQKELDQVTKDKEREVMTV